jgi:epoxide hydrolase-like predicted phosphatase
MIRAVVFDWGGVLMRTVDVRPRLAWQRRLGLPPRGLVDLFFGGPVWRRALDGQATLDDVWAEVAQRLGLGEEEIAALSHDFWAGDQLDRDLVSLIRNLRAQGLRMALLSNHIAGLPCLLADLDLDALFDAVIVSALEGVTKPDPAIYRCALERLGVVPDEVVFVDDFGRNVAAARDLGMVGIRFRGVAHLRRALAANGLPVEIVSPVHVPGIRAVTFDWGGVLCRSAHHGREPEWERRLGLARGTLDSVLWGPEWKQLEVGAIASEAFDAHVAHSLGLPDREAVRQFYREYFGDDCLERQVVAAVRALQSRYRLAMLTNAFPGHAESAKERYGFDPRTEFDVYVNSAEVGLAKPDPAIYQLVLDQLAVAPPEAVFLDDMVRNTDAAQALGMHTLVFTDAETGLADLAALLDHPFPLTA